MTWGMRGAWLAPRSGRSLTHPDARATLARLRTLGVTHVAIGQDVNMPEMKRPALEWGRDDDDLRATLRAVRAEGMAAMLVPRIESPAFFEPPYPFRADIRFGTAADWDRFHDVMQDMLVHYAKLCAEEKVAVFCLGIELKHSVKEHPDRWRAMIAAVRRHFAGALTYSANWYDEWEQVSFWDALDHVGIGAYFELKPRRGRDAKPPSASAIAARWRPVLSTLRALSQRCGKPVLFTEIGYPGYRDCAEKPWEWAGKQDKGVPIDHRAQARAFAGMFAAAGRQEWMTGAFLWTFYTTDRDVAGWEYAIRGRPAEDEVRSAYRRAR